MLLCLLQEDQIRVKETFARLNEQLEVAKAMPIEVLSEVVRAKAQMAVRKEWTVDAIVHILSEQGLDNAYRAFQATFANPPPTGAEVSTIAGPRLDLNCHKSVMGLHPVPRFRLKGFPTACHLASLLLRGFCGLGPQCWAKL